MPIGSIATVTSRGGGLKFPLCVQVNEFHHAPVDFIFTSPLNDSVLPPLRVSGDGVLKEFGFVPGRGLVDAAMVWLLVACFGMLTYFFLETAGRYELLHEPLHQSTGDVQ